MFGGRMNVREGTHTRKAGPLPLAGGDEGITWPSGITVAGAREPPLPRAELAAEITVAHDARRHRRRRPAERDPPDSIGESRRANDRSL
jgi:hypothetical protein